MSGKLMSRVKTFFGAKIYGPNPDPQPGATVPNGKKVFSSKDYEFVKDLAEMRERMKKPDNGKEKKEFTKQEVLDRLRKMAKDFELVEKDLNIPEMLYKRDERGNTFSENPDKDSSYMAHEVRRENARLPNASELVYTLGIFDTSMQTYFVMVDPSRKLIVVDQLLYLGQGSWDNVAQSLKEAMEYQMLADYDNQKYNLIIAVHRSVRII